MAETRRDFLARSAAALAAAAAAAPNAASLASTASTEAAPEPTPTPAPAGGTPPAFGTAPPVGPEITTATVAEAEKLVRVEMTAADRAQAAGNWASAMAGTMERRSGPRKVTLEPSLAPATKWDPRIPGSGARMPAADRFVRTAAAPGALPANDDDIAFAPVASLSRWIQSRALTSERLTRIYFERIDRFDPKLKSVITATRELAIEQARRADAEIAAGKYRGPLHGIPWGTKDLLDTKGIRTTWGAEPYRDRIPDADAAVVARLHRAGAVLVAKLSLGALALNDVWFGGQTLNPWLADVGEVFPVRHLADALLVAYNPHTTGLGFAGLDLLIVAAWGAAGLLVALRTFSWQPLGR